MNRTETLIKHYLSVSNIRHQKLFTEFLPKGYDYTTLNSVTSNHFDDAQFAKLCLAMIITLYDDLADNPTLYNPKLLKELYKLNLNEIPDIPKLYSESDVDHYDLARELFYQLENTIKTFPNHGHLLALLIFDIKHIFFANQYSEAMTRFPQARNLTESKMLGPYNMGMVASGIIDLMASPDFHLSDTGAIREAFIIGQRLGRISNVLTTFEREVQENDVTNELMIGQHSLDSKKEALLKEFNTGLADIIKLQDQIPSVDLSAYSNGLSKFYELHLNMKGII